MKSSPDLLAVIGQAMAELRRAQADPEILELMKLARLVLAYAAHGEPFGESLAAAIIWERYGQQTTQN